MYNNLEHFACTLYKRPACSYISSLWCNLFKEKFIPFSGLPNTLCTGLLMLHVLIQEDCATLPAALKMLFT